MTPQEKLWIKSGILEEFWPLGFDSYRILPDDPGAESKENALKIIKEYVDLLVIARRRGISLFLHGSNGTGKTMLGVCILKEALSRGFSAQFASLGTIVQTLTDGWYDDTKRRLYEDRIKNVDFLMIDDIGKEYKSHSGLTEIAFDNLVRYRTFRNKPMILTTNTDIKDIANTYGNSLLSLLAGKFIPVKVIGGDFRKTVLAKNVLERLREDV
jgi:DNA replication protein DnaC